MRIDIKPLSVNGAYRGRRFASKELKNYKDDLNKILPHISIPDGKLEARYVFGVSSQVCDVDNFIKAFQDCVAERYGFNDNRIFKITVEKVCVKKGSEFIDFEIKNYESNTTKT